MRDQVIERNLHKEYWHETRSPALEGLMGTLYCVSNGYLGVRGTAEEMPDGATPGFYVAGSFCEAPMSLVPILPMDHALVHPEKAEEFNQEQLLSTLPNLPFPLAVSLRVDGKPVDFSSVSVGACERRMRIDEATYMRRLVFRDWDNRRTVIDSERFASWDERRIVCMRYMLTADSHDAEFDAVPFLDERVTNDQNLKLWETVQARHEDHLNALTVKPNGTGPLFLGQAWNTQNQYGRLTLEVVTAVSEVSLDDACAICVKQLALGFDALKARHVAAVKKCYESSAIEFDGDAFACQGFNFGQMHMEMALPWDNPRTTVLVKGLTGEGYKFAILWDTDFHLFPYYLYTNPSQARNLLLYRYKTLNGARQNARDGGWQGAKYPWESGPTGREECTPWLILPDREIHISADVSWAVKMYVDATGDRQFLAEHGAEIVFETARFYASRVTYNDSAKRYEIHNVGCPDQYHTTVNNSAFVNRMAKWNLEYALELTGDEDLAKVRSRIGLEEKEIERMRDAARSLYVIAPDENGIIEEFDGYFQLSTDLRGISEEFCEHTQAIKQPDVQLLFIPFAEEYDREIQSKNWEFYSSRCFHGSSLGMAGFALSAARIGLTDQALDYFNRATRADLDSLRPDSHMGVHLASYGVLWQSLVMGFGGFRPNAHVLEFEPHMPRQWRMLRFRLTWQGCKVEVQLSRDLIRVVSDQDNPQEVPLKVGNVERTLRAGDEASIAFREFDCSVPLYPKGWPALLSNLRFRVAGPWL